MAEKRITEGVNSAFSRSSALIVVDSANKVNKMKPPN